MRIVYCKSEYDNKAYDFFMKFIPSDSISSSLEALAFVTMFDSQISNHEGEFNWNDSNLQDFISRNGIQLKENPVSVNASNDIYFSTDADKAFDFLRHIHNALVHGLIIDDGYDYGVYDLDSYHDLPRKKSHSEIRKYLNNIPGSRITMKGRIRKYLFWDLIIQVIKSNNNL